MEGMWSQKKKWGGGSYIINIIHAHYAMTYKTILQQYYNPPGHISIQFKKTTCFKI